ncbi:hypothetical protein [Microvirga mediterraneensis]|uniref:Uncharacterized protein n=1 Tax=Microvirga mediterraneensis TaxID=2754695 RepID=A0A838BQJ6_9HYPH|nr:hypothetical protein [Microvirga mediterraneensis]MBA1156890.1 hypothetical protein [Microvirga mediterraneensis]MBA1157807.1 hypothetical protein [Microvirga mediterraneensis]
MTEMREKILERALRSIMQACEDGRVCDDVAWYDQYITLYDFCATELERSQNAEAQTELALLSQSSPSGGGMSKGAPLTGPGSRPADHALSGHGRSGFDPLRETEASRHVERITQSILDNCPGATPDGARYAAVEPAQEIERLERERDGAHKAADWNMLVVADRDAENERLKAEIKAVREGIQKAKNMLDEGIPSGEPVHPVSAYLTTLAVRLGEAFKGEKA